MPASSLHTLVALAAVADAFSPAAQTKPRHLVLIVADDLGYADLGYTGSEIRTPNIDGLANSGVDMFTELQPPYVRGTRTSRPPAVRTRGAGQLAPGASLLRLWYGHRPCTRGDTPKAVYRVPFIPPGEQRGEARQLLRPAGVQPDACGAPHGPVQHPVRLPIGRAHRPQQLLSATHRDAAAAVRAAHARREGARGGQVAPGLPPLGAHANLPWL